MQLSAAHTRLSYHTSDLQYPTSTVPSDSLALDYICSVARCKGMHGHSQQTHQQMCKVIELLLKDDGEEEKIKVLQHLKQNHHVDKISGIFFNA